MSPRTLQTIALSLLMVVVMNTAYFALPNRAFAQAAGGATAGGASADGGANDLAVKCGITKAVKWAADIVIGWVTDAAPKPGVSSNSGADQAKTITGYVWDCLDALWKTLLKIAFNKFKKRLLDRLTDDVVGWISGSSGKPKFITNFNSFLKDTADAALGDTIQAIGAGKLCSSKLSLQVRLSITTASQQRKLSDRVTCTLSKAVGNINAFANDFRNGNFLAFEALNRPENNKYGLQLMAFDSLDTQTTKKTDAMKTEVGGSNGFLSTKYCKQWSVLGQALQGDGTWSDLIVIGTMPSNDIKEFIDPNTKPSLVEAKKRMTTSATCTNLECSEPIDIECKKEDQVTTTPGQTLGAIVGANVASNDKDALVNSDDLTPYLGKIFDAAFNRLAKEGVRGLSKAKDSLFSNSSRGQEPAAQTNPVYLGYGSSMTSAATTDPSKTVATSSIVSASRAAIASTTEMISLIQAKITEVEPGVLTWLSALNTLSSCEQNVKTTCASTMDMWSKLNDASQTIESAKKSIVAANTTISNTQKALNDPNTDFASLVTASAQVQVLPNQLATTLSNLNNIPQLVTALDTRKTKINTQQQMCTAAAGLVSQGKPVVPPYTCATFTDTLPSGGTGGGTGTGGSTPST